MPAFLASGCRQVSCSFQQGFDHPTAQSEIAGLLAVAFVVLVIRAIAKSRRRS